jgi:hypothetical protein
VTPRLLKVLLERVFNFERCHSIEVIEKFRYFNKILRAGVTKFEKLIQNMPSI